MLRKILIADDNVTIRKQLQQQLQGHGYDVATVGNGEMAVAKIHEILPHMVMLDLIMPGKNGYEVCEYVKHNPTLSQIPVILLFSDNEPFDIAEARRVGATRCLPKTIEVDQLVSILDFIWAGITPIEYSVSAVDDNDDDNTIDYALEDDFTEEVETTVEMDFDPVSVEVESLEEDLIQTREVTEKVSEEVSEENIQTPDALPAYQFEVKTEEVKIDEPAYQPDESPIAESLPPLQLHTDHSEVEIPGLESTNRKAVSAYETPVMNQPNTMDQKSEVFEQFLQAPITGAHFKYTPPPEESADDPLQIVDTLTSAQCRECGAVISNTDVFCVECGAAVEEMITEPREQSNCEQCGDIINQGDVFCLNCGAVL